MKSEKNTTAHPAATVIPVRNNGRGLEVLLLKRNPDLAFHGGAWVFPGGRIDPGDYTQAGTADIIDAARMAAVREAREEASLEIAPETMIWISRWTTPRGFPKRFEAWFFLADAAGQAVQVDGGEIHAARWMSPDQAIRDHEQGRLRLPLPTYVSVEMLIPYRDVRSALRAFSERQPLICDG
ncbi:NUDIX hydrolase [Desulfonema ishimotonii]|uniref:NUDIX hydrolase n=1 Tax=Desulfonema ishimotonii TaxID=45657 RepID=A0A401G339_9BACT|nr:NUDIX hydrolase [Desulfonema ishimotonii]GBC63535.1 NUDIX hydrolase [Desulfonema ishimotonii]